MPVLGFAVLPSFTNQEEQDVELGPIDEFPEGQFVIATYLEDPEVGEVTRRTMFIRNNGIEDGVPSFTMLYSLRAPRLPGAAERPDRRGGEEGRRRARRRADPGPRDRLRLPVPRRPVRHRGNRTAGPPVRALDRAEFSIKDGNLYLGKFFSVAEVEVRAPALGSTSTAARCRRPRRRGAGVALPDRGAVREARPALAARGDRVLSLDWLEERLGLVGAIHYFLRKVSRDTNWSTLGSATLTAFLVQTITGRAGVLLQARPRFAYESIQFITNDLTSAGSSAACTSGVRASSSS